MNALLIITSDAFATRQQIQDHLNTVKEITYWYSCLPHCIFCTSMLTAAQLAKQLEEQFGHSKGRRFLVMRANADRQGRLPAEAWHLLNNPDSPKMK